MFIYERFTTKRTPYQPRIFHRPWSKLGVDICYIDDRMLLIIIDYFSNFIEVCRLNSKTAMSIVKEMQGVFARFGVPDQVITDNGPQFCTKEFTKFTRQWDFEHITSPCDGRTFAKVFLDERSSFDGRSSSRRSCPLRSGHPREEVILDGRSSCEGMSFSKVVLDGM